MLSIMYSDNFSRSKALIFFNVAQNIGFLTIFFSQNIAMVIIGMFIVSFGGIPMIRTSQTIISEISSLKLKERFLSLFMAGLSVGVLVGGVFYQMIGHWRYSTLYIALIPSLI